MRVSRSKVRAPTKQQLRSVTCHAMTPQTHNAQPASKHTKAQRSQHRVLRNSRISSLSLYVQYTITITHQSPESQSLTSFKTSTSRIFNSILIGHGVDIHISSRLMQSATAIIPIPIQFICYLAWHLQTLTLTTQHRCEPMTRPNNS